MYQSIHKSIGNSFICNGFVTEQIHKYTIFCFFAAYREERIKEVIADKSITYAVLSVFAFLVQGLVTDCLLFYAKIDILATRHSKTEADIRFDY